MIELKNKEELSRLEFLEERDGRAGAMEFALRTFDTYRLIVLNAKRKRLASRATCMFVTTSVDNRASFVKSCLSFREYIRKYR
jgi:hypothetical protein